jgi:uncharacterized protein (DUF1499 family)
MDATKAKKTGATMKLPPCPPSPNCVTSQDPEKGHAVSPFDYTGTPADARRALLAVLQEHPRTRIVSQTTAYIRAEFRSPVFGFVDIGEFVIREEKPIIDIRCASRTGYYDFGVNRRRAETLRRHFNRLMEHEPIERKRR